jgi:carbonic anhydrase
MSLYKQIFKNNDAWVAEKVAKDENFFKDLSQGQSPEILYIGCSDSRVTAEEMTGTQPGQIERITALEGAQ